MGRSLSTIAAICSYSLRRSAGSRAVRDLALGNRHVLGIERIGGRHPLIPYGGFAIHRDLHDTFAIQGQLESLTHTRVLAQRILLREIALAYIDRDALVADLGDLR